MAKKQIVLIVDDDQVNRRILAKILSDDYETVEAENGREALTLLERQASQLAAVILDLNMPVMDGFAFLDVVRQTEEYKNIPVVISTGNNSRDAEIRALQMGAWDFVTKPYDPTILKFRLRNAIDRSQLSALHQLKYLAEYDKLTGIYNKEQFFGVTRRMLDESAAEQFVLIRFDIDRFKLINSFYSTEEGDHLLQYIGKLLEKSFFGRENCTYGRIEADVFACCVGYSTREHVMRVLERVGNDVKRYNRDFDIVPIFGVYFLDDRTLPVDVLMDRATLAGKTCKGNYVKTIGIYQPEMSRQLEREQEIINEMAAALEKGQFLPYYQPKYSLATNAPCGAEALVRWKHPVRGMLPPSEFIPVLEKNGFIERLDYFIWKQVCRQLRRWIDAGRTPNPISVNVSRADLYNPQLVDRICELTKRFGVPNHLLQLELTESAYMDNPQTMKQTVRRLRSCGFTVLMDDFGNAYSSLSILKDIEVDILKIDMGFLSQCEIPGRSENIIASIVRMAKWLSIPTIAEGAETQEQAEFLRSIGCEYVQGYCFGRPMPVEQYEAITDETAVVKKQAVAGFDLDSLWMSNPQVEMLFSNATQATAIYEFEADHIEVLRVNKAFYQTMGYGAIHKERSPLETVLPEYHAVILATFRKSVEEQGFAECKYQKKTADGRCIWIHMQLQYVNRVGMKHILCGSLLDITQQKKMEAELKKYKTALNQGSGATNRLLIVDDSEVEREILKQIFRGRFTLLEAANGEEALRVLAEHENRVDAILLDLIMPVMDGEAFLKERQMLPVIGDIPVIIITADDAPEQQIHTLSLGVSDYIVKPFISEVVSRRVQNVLESKSRIREILEEYRSVLEQAQIDPLTQLYNRAAAEERIGRILAGEPEQLHAMLMIDLDNFKEINDTHGHSYGDQVLMEFGEKLKHFFRSSDTCVRFGGDEFCVFLQNVPSEQFVQEKAMRLCREVGGMKIGQEKMRITCSVGIAVNQRAGNRFTLLYESADLALYEAKRSGKNSVMLYGSDFLTPVQ